MAVLASVLFIVAAITDFFDDYFGGTVAMFTRSEMDKF